MRTRGSLREIWGWCIMWLITQWYMLGCPTQQQPNGRLCSNVPAPRQDVQNQPTPYPATFTRCPPPGHSSSTLINTNCYHHLCYKRVGTHRRVKGDVINRRQWHTFRRRTLQEKAKTAWTAVMSTTFSPLTWILLKLQWASLLTKMPPPSYSSLEA